MARSRIDLAGLAAAAEGWFREVRRRIGSVPGLTEEDCCMDFTVSVVLLCGSVMEANGCVLNTRLTSDRYVRWDLVYLAVRALESMGMRAKSVTGSSIVFSGRPPFVGEMRRAAETLESFVSAPVVGVKVLGDFSVSSSGDLSVRVGAGIGACHVLPDGSTLMFNAIQLAAALGAQPCCPMAISTSAIRPVAGREGLGDRRRCIWIKMRPDELDEEPRLDLKKSKCPSLATALEDLIYGIRWTTPDPDLLEALSDSNLIFLEWFAPSLEYLLPEDYARALEAMGERVRIFSLNDPSARSGAALLVTGPGRMIVVSHSRFAVGDNYFRIIAPREEVPLILKRMILGLAKTMWSERTYRRLERRLSSLTRVDEIIEAARTVLAQEEPSPPD